ncbi:MAG: hypothetical protein KME19_17680 [Microcoleus vaginatus WJT46-NPBG5]|nr:hypothetical protein [Microcoleus vaginatus WJT46-NPBG5]
MYFPQSPKAGSLPGKFTLSQGCRQQFLSFPLSPAIISQSRLLLGSRFQRSNYQPFWAYLTIALGSDTQGDNTHATANS